MFNYQFRDLNKNNKRLQINKIKRVKIKLDSTGLKLDKIFINFGKLILITIEIAAITCIVLMLSNSL